jgi:hypothetical protein
MSSVFKPSRVNKSTPALSGAVPYRRKPRYARQALRRMHVTSRVMFPPPCQGGMLSSTAALPNSADARGAEDLMPRENIEIAADGLHIDGHVRNGLGIVDQHSRTLTVRHFHHLHHRNDRAEGVGDV